MKLRLHEIEFGTEDPAKSKQFYHTILGLDTKIDQEHLNVFNPGISGVDFNTSAHFPSKIVVTSFLTENLQQVIDRLNTNGVAFTGPEKSHLGMTTIQCKDPDGYTIKINQPTDESPSWLKV
jgi:predicted enzyme related to lactoylglutathione lyase